MNSEPAFRPYLLLQQANNEFKRLSYINVAQQREYLIRAIQSIANQPEQLQPALAYTIPMSHLEGLFLLLVSEEQLELRETIFKLISQRLHLRFSGKVWELFQRYPDNLEIARLLGLLSLKTKHQDRIIDADHVLSLIANLQQSNLLFSEDCVTFLQPISSVLLQRFLDFDLNDMTVDELFKYYEIIPSSVFSRRLLSKYFESCSENNYLENHNELMDFLSVWQEDSWVVINHYCQVVRSECFSDDIGELISEKIPVEFSDLNANMIEEQTVQKFAVWKILMSIRRSLKNTRLIELLIRNYTLIQSPAEPIVCQPAEGLESQAAGIKINLKNFVLVVPNQDECIYLYSIDQFTTSERIWTAALLTLSKSSNGIGSEESDSSIHNKFNESTESSAVYLPRWPIDKGLLVSARQAILEEEDKKAEEPSIFSLLANNKIASIIQLSMDDTHYLFARKIFDEIVAYEDAAKD